MPRTRKTHEQPAPEPARVWKVAIYIRLSKEDEDKQSAGDDSGSVAEQRKINADYVASYFASRGQAYEVVDYYIDDGRTGTDTERREFQRMLRDAATGRIDCIVVKVLHRAFRNYADQGKHLEEIFPRMGIRFISEGPHVDSFEDFEAISEGMEIPLNGIINDRVSAKTSREVRRTFDMKRRRGEFIGGFAPYGYRKHPDNKNALLVDEEAASVVRDIYHWFVHEGMSKNAIAGRLNDRGVRNPTYYKREVQRLNYRPGAKNASALWTGHTVALILQNRVYVGDMVQGRYRVVSYKVHDQVRTPENEWIIVENTHRAIIDRQLFAKAQALHRQETRVPAGKTTKHLFAGFVRCSDCGKALRRRSWGSHHYLFCRTFSDQKRCTRRSIREDRLAQAVLDAIRAQIGLVESIEALIDEVQAQPPARTQSDQLGQAVRARERELEQIRALADGLYADWKLGEMTREEFRRRGAAYADRQRELEAALEALREEADRAKAGAQSQNHDWTAFCRHRNITALDRAALVELVEGIRLHENGGVTIDLCFADPLERLASAPGKPGAAGPKTGAE